MRARKRFGQHFLERAWVEKVMRAIDPKPGDVFIEIGPGRGALTGPLTAASLRVVAFEIDRDLVATLAANAPPTLTVVPGDFLKTTRESLTSRLETVDRSGAPDGGVRVAGNLPYNVASPIMFKLVDLFRGGVALRDATLMLQREVADRVLASPGSKDYGVLTLVLRQASDAQRLLALPPGAFRPPPKVDSALIRLRFHPDNPKVSSPETFRKLIQSAFSRRRKTLSNALAAFDPDRRHVQAVLEQAGIDGTRRPETLDIDEFAALAHLFTPREGHTPPVL
jgi:16S rRNA (adenine1518-N6/adenine1519-N6)-dimethyltransferase